MTDQLSDLTIIMDTVYQADLGNLRRIREDEAALRQALADLDDQLRQGLEASVNDQVNWRSIGADQAWRKWLTQQRREVNMQLALTLARKGEATDKLKMSFAKKQVSDELLELQSIEKRMQRTKHQY